MQMDADPRLAAAAGGAMRFLADAAGLENSVIAQLQMTVVAVCTEAFEHLSHKHPHVGIDFTRYVDRIEVSLTHEGDDDDPLIGLDTIAGFTPRGRGGPSGSGTFPGVDRVQYETHGSEVTTRLTKYLGKVIPSR